MNTTKKPSTELERFGKLLEEARSIHGVSLGKDAWRRLRKNRGSMIALWFLIITGLLALFTPLLPLQSPILNFSENRKYLEPVWESHTFEFNVEDKISNKELQDYINGEEINPNDQSGENADSETAGIDNVIGKSFGSKRTWFDRMLIKARFKIFGNWCIGSIFGTDNLGRDLFSRVFWGARVSLMVGLIAGLVSLVIGVTYGAIAGYCSGWVDNIMMRIVDVLYSIPFIFVVIFILTILSEDSIKKSLDAHGIDKISIFFVVIGAIYWLTMSRVVRGQIISLKHEQYIEAAKTIGASRGRIIFRHLVPNVLSIVIVYLTLTIPSVMLFEAFLSFLGLGVDPPDVSWGILASEGIKEISAVKIRWWLVVFPGVSMGLTLMALNILGDGLRDALDPRMKNK